MKYIWNVMKQMASFLACVNCCTCTLAFAGENTSTHPVCLAGGTTVIGANSAFGDESIGAPLSLSNATVKITASLALDNGGVNKRNVTLAGSNVFDVGANDLTISGVISGPGSFTKTGTGTMTLSANNEHKGSTTVSQGALSVKQMSSVMNIASGAILTVNETGGFGNRYVNAGTIDFEGYPSMWGIGGLSPGESLILDNGTVTGSGGCAAYGAFGTALYNHVDAAKITITANGAANLINTTYGINLRAALTLNTPRVSDTLNIVCGIGATNATQAHEGTLTKTGLGTVILAGTGVYTNTTTIKAGTLVATCSSALGNGPVKVSTGSALSYIAATDSPLNLASTLVINGGPDTMIGGSVGSDRTSAAIHVAGVVTASDAINVNVYRVGSVANVSSGKYTLLHGAPGSNLNVPKYSLGTVYNNIDFTVDPGNTFGSSTATDLICAIIRETPLSAAYWTGGLAGAANVWAASDGKSNSNWAATSGGSSQALVPGAGADVTVANSKGTTFLGANMTVKSLTIADTANGLNLNNDGYTLTINPLVSTGWLSLKKKGAGITVNAGVPDSVIAEKIALGSDQVWAVADVPSSLTIVNQISGNFELTKAGAGALTLLGANIYGGATVISQGTLRLGKVRADGSNPGLVINGKLPATTAVNLANSGTMLDLYDSCQTVASLAGVSGSTVALGSGCLKVGDTNSTTFAGLICDKGVSGSKGGSLTKVGAGTLKLGNANTYTGGTIISGGTLKMGVANCLPVGGALKMLNVADAVLDLNGFDQTIGALSIGGPTGGNIALGGGTLIVGDASHTSYGGVISGAGSLTKQGAGTLTLTGAHRYSGPTVINSGTLKLQQKQSLSNLNGSRILPLGDSITCGFGGSNAGYRGFLYKSLTDAEIAFQFVGTTWHDNPGSLPTTPVDQTWHQGYGGQVTGFILDNIATILHDLFGKGKLPNIITLLIGTNDATRNIPPSTAAANVAQIIDLVCRRVPGITMFIAQITPRPGKEEWIATYNKVLADVVARKQEVGNRVVLVDMHTGFPANGIADGIHPNDAGYKFITKQWTSAILDSIKMSGGGDNLLPVTTPLSIASNALLDLNGANQQVASLTGSGMLNNSSADLASVFTVGDSNSSAFSGTITGNLGLTKSGAGTLTLTGSNNFAGNTTVNGGTLEVASASALGKGARLTIAQGATVKLTVNTVVKELYFGDKAQEKGTWGAIGNSGVNHTSEYLTGKGILMVTGILTEHAQVRMLNDQKGIIIKPIPEKMVVLTFDDSCVSHATFVAPLLKKYGFGATFYITEAFTDTNMYMSWSQIKGLEEMGFEVGNHSLHHGMFSNMKVDECTREMLGIDADCVKNNVTKPTTFCWPMYGVNKDLFPVMVKNGYLFARSGGDHPYDPIMDNPFEAPCFTFYNAMLKSWPHLFADKVTLAVPGKFVIVCFHGIPDLQHGNVGLDPEIFERLMKYLKDNNYTVIAMRDMAKYVDAAKAAK